MCSNRIFFVYFVVFSGGDFDRLVAIILQLMTRNDTISLIKPTTVLNPETKYSISGFATSALPL